MLDFSRITSKIFNGLARDVLDLKNLDYPSPVDHNLLCPVCQPPFECDHVFYNDCFNIA